MVGYASLVAGSDGPGLVFEASQPPILELGSLTLAGARWEAPGGTVTLAVERVGATLARLTGPVSPGSGRLVIDLGEATLALPARWRPDGGRSPRLEAIWAARGQPPALGLAALATLDPPPAGEEAVAAVALAASLSARAGDAPRAVALFEQAADGALALGLVTQAVEHLGAAAFHQARQDDLAEAQRLVARMAAIEQATPDRRAAVLVAWFDGLVLGRLDRLSRATERLEHAVLLADAIGDAGRAAAAREALAGLLADQGRHADARAALADLPTPASPVAAWRRGVNVAWQRLLSMQACEIKDDFVEAAAAFESLAQAPWPSWGPMSGPTPGSTRPSLASWPGRSRRPARPWPPPAPPTRGGAGSGLRRSPGRARPPRCRGRAGRPGGLRRRPRAGARPDGRGRRRRLARPLRPGPRRGRRRRRRRPGHLAAGPRRAGGRLHPHGAAPCPGGLVRRSARPA
ncbi:MAG: hypothetical protein R3F60_09655 [bacterium]